MEREKNVQNAQGAVEFALVVPIVLLIVFGMLEIGHLIFVYGSVLNASREAARYGAVTGLVNGHPQYQDCAGIANTATRVKFLANYSTSDVDIKFDSGPGTTPINTCSAMTTSQWTQISSGTGTYRIVVTISSPYSVLVPLVPIPNFTMISSSSRTILGSLQVASAIAAPGSVGNPPAITGVSPSSGPTAGGSSVTITGTDLTGATLVSFGGSTATACVVVSATLITCNTPSHSAGTVTISVTTPIATGVSGSIYTYVSPPTISSISPAAGSSTGGTLVTIFGANLTNGSVSFGGTSANCTVNSATNITCTSPAGAGTVSLVVSTLGGTASTSFNYITPAPTISNLNPTSGSMSGGTSVQINGTNLSTGTVKFGANTATCTVNSAVLITCTTPSSANSGSVSVVVTTSGGSASSSFT